MRLLRRQDVGAQRSAMYRCVCDLFRLSQLYLDHNRYTSFSRQPAVRTLTPSARATFNRLAQRQATPTDRDTTIPSHLFPRRRQCSVTIWCVAGISSHPPVPSASRKGPDRCSLIVQTAQVKAEDRQVPLVVSKCIAAVEAYGTHRPCPRTRSRQLTQQLVPTQA